MICVIKVKTGEDGKLFGAVTAGMIADELKHQFDVTLDKKKIQLESSIRALGEHEIELNLHHDVKGTLKVRVESTTPVAVPEGAANEAKGEDTRARTEKRGKHQAEAEKAPVAEAKPKTEKKGKVDKKAKSE
jgi:large subunit ribosomal protein L9